MAPRKKAGRKAGKLVKAGKRKIGSRSRQLYHVSGSTKKFYLQGVKKNRVYVK